MEGLHQTVGILQTLQGSAAPHPHVGSAGARGMKTPGFEHLLLPGLNLCLLSELTLLKTLFKFYFTHIKAWDLEHGTPKV